MAYQYRKARDHPSAQIVTSLYFLYHLKMLKSLFNSFDFFLRTSRLSAVFRFWLIVIPTQFWQLFTSRLLLKWEVNQFSSHLHLTFFSFSFVVSTLKRSNFLNYVYFFQASKIPTYSSMGFTQDLFCVFSRNSVIIFLYSIRDLSFSCSDFSSDHPYPSLTLSFQDLSRYRLRFS